MKSTCYRLLVFAFLLMPSSGLVASSYDQATAHAPNFEDKQVWPGATGKERYVEQKWPQGRVMEWAHPGKNGGPMRNGLDLLEPANWLLDGKPATEVRFDENTDLVLPESETEYSVLFKAASGWDSIYRHITVGRNAAMKDEAASYFGNIWVKEGGRIYGAHGNTFRGAGNTFLRWDGTDSTDPRSGRFGQYFGLEKTDADLSVEMIGTLSVLDRVAINSGTLIIGPDSRFSPGRNATMVINEGGTVALMDGARLGKWVNQIGIVDFTLFGTLLGGLPERPLERPAYLLVSYQNTTGIKFFERLTAPEGQRRMETRVAPLIVANGSTIRSISGPSGARLNIRLTDVDAKDWHLTGDAGYREWVKGLSEEDRAYLEQQLDALPRNIVTAFQEEVTVDGVVFNDYHKGGILVENLESIGNWKNFTMGTGNQAEGEAMFQKISRVDTRRHVKSSGGEYNIGHPQVFASETYEADDFWSNTELVAPVPVEGKGCRLGVRFEHKVGTGWGYIDNVRLSVNGKDWIVNGDFSVPELSPNQRIVRFSDVPGWEDMARPNPESGTIIKEDRQVGATHTARSAFGQTTEAVGDPSGEVVLTFEYSASQPSGIRAELFYLHE